VNRGQALVAARCRLEEAGIEEAPLEGEVLLRHVLNVSRAALFAGLDADLTPAQEKALAGLLERRLLGEPLAYITGVREFYGLEFRVDPRVLIPRPESELLVEKAISLARDNNIATMADIGTGSGAIAVSLAVNLPGIAVYATDIAAVALEVARANARRHGVEKQIAFLRGNLLEPLPGPVDVIIANLPYVRRAELSLKGEPSLALDGGADGLDLIRVLCQEADKKLRDGGFLLLEVGQGQARDAAALLSEAFPFSKIETDRDLAGIERVLTLRLTRRRVQC
jgi:release factor glutamine methyltransferase